jgi:Fe-S-cluster containining protein
MKYSLAEIPEAIRGELCAGCGKCCRVMILEGLAIDRRLASDRAFLEWIDLHGASSTVERRNGRQSLTVTIPKPCTKLEEAGGRSRCGIYEGRPLTCREYSCLDDPDIGDTAWKRYIREHRGKR